MAVGGPDRRVPVPAGPYTARVVICAPDGEELWQVTVGLVRPGDTITYRVPEVFLVSFA